MPATFPLPTTIDSSYPDSGTDPTVALHQQQHDLVHDTLNNNGRCLAWTSYAPATNTTVSSSATFGVVSAVDATNLIVTFTAPPSGKVKVLLSALCYTNGAAASLGWCLLDANNSNAVISGSYKYISGNTAATATLYSVVFTGLTPGTSYSWRFGQYNAGNSGGTTGYGQPNNANAYGPATMEVWAMP